MNIVNLKANIAEAVKGFENENVKVTVATSLPEGVKISDGKGRGTPLPIGTQSVSVVAFKNIKGVSKKFDFYLLTVAMADGSLYDVSVDGDCPPVEGSNPTKMWQVDCTHNAKGYPIIKFSNIATPIVVASMSGEVPL